MRKIRELLRLHFDLKMSQRNIARSLGIAHPTVSDYIVRAENAGLVWPLPEAMDGTESKIFSGRWFLRCFTS